MTGHAIGTVLGTLTSGPNRIPRLNTNYRGPEISGYRAILRDPEFGPKFTFDNLRRRTQGLRMIFRNLRDGRISS